MDNSNFATNSNFIALESIQIATPCHADWSKMRGDDRVRHCQSCVKNVYNFSAMTRLEAQRLIEEKEGNLCVRLHRRADGTVITSDCQIGVSPVKKSAQWFGMALGALVAAILGVFGVQSSYASRSQIQVTAGAPMDMGRMPVSIRGEIAIPTPTPKPASKAVKMPVKHHGKRASGTKNKSNRKSNSRKSNPRRHRR